MKPVCSIIIRAYNEEKHIGRLLDGILQQTIKNVQIILVDSGSSDNTIAIAETYPVDIVQIKPHEFTFGRSLNIGIQQADANLLVFASAHVYPVYPDWLERLLEPFNDDRVALSYGKQRGSTTTQFSEHMIFAHWFPEISNFHQDHPFCNNANAAIRKKLWEIHPYNETLPGLEDLAWARWAHEQGYRIAYVAEAEIIHVHNESWKGIANRYRREGMAFKTIYPHEQFRIWELLSAFFKNVRTDFVAAKKQSMLKKYWKAIIGFRWNQFWGTYQGYKQSGPLTWQLKQAFYYPRMELNEETVERDVEPIHYHEISEENH